MKKLLVPVVTLLLASPVMADDQLAASMCGYIKDDNRNQLRKMLTDNKLNVRNIYDSIKCNGENMLQFAIRSDAYESGTFIIKQMPAKTLSEFDYDSWATSNGFGTSSLVNEIRARIGK